MTVGTALHPRTAVLNSTLQWREWSGYFAASVYATSPDIEYNAIREAAALIDVSPLFKYQVHGPDAVRLVDRVITRDATKIRVGQVAYAVWCDEDGRVVDDGTIARLDDVTFRWTAADPTLRWLRQNARGLDVRVDEVTESVAALALQGPLARWVLEVATGESFGDLRYYRRRPSHLGRVPIDVTRTGYTGDLGYELWIPAAQAVRAWDAIMAAGRPFGLRPAGMLALDLVRIEAGLILIDVDYTSVRRAVTAEQAYSPFEIGLGRLVDLAKADFVGRRALEAEQRAGGPSRRLVGLEIAWADVESLHAVHGLPPTVPAVGWRQPVPLYASGRQVGRATSGCWSPLLKRNVALGSVPAAYADLGTTLRIEWTVEATRGLANATVVPLPFLDLERRRA